MSTVNIKSSCSTHNIYDVTFHSDRIQTLVTNSPSVVESWISEIELTHRSGLKNLIVGLDTEHHPNFKRNDKHRVATLQLCVGNRCLIFQIFQASYIPQALKNFLLNDNYSFVGQCDRSENSDCSSAWTGHEGVEAGLKSLSEKVLKKKIEKPKEIQRSNWDDRSLSPDRVQYACLDAFVSYEIGRTLKTGSLSSSSSSSLSPGLLLMGSLTALAFAIYKS
ncbi:hypothetical protein JRO89_XS11G0001700 [Xanthoceras sorbifolium]|uniref:3'-5' exonuclease domain-containing protein n=1 Tax=Xanthoceras sorbifolium TaxID=99658 RepID=A0ABQ8HDX8_9ROSI|nr:hypothetical protein JRO89_XS11G0001700 [Xanthoceras sorbifolium]